MNPRKALEYGGYITGVILIVFGVAAIYMGVDGRSTVRDSLDEERIHFGNAEEDEAVAEHAEQWSEEQVKTGDQARAFALVMRDHALESAGGLTYAQMGRYQSKANPDDPAGTNDPTAAATSESGDPIPNGPRNTWVTETALSTALNMSYMAEQLALFGIVVGVALLLAGIGFMILAFLAVRNWAREGAAARA